MKKEAFLANVLVGAKLVSQSIFVADTTEIPVVATRNVELDEEGSAGI